MENKLSIVKIFNFVDSTQRSRCITEVEMASATNHLIMCGEKMKTDYKIAIYASCMQSSSVNGDPHEITGLLLKENKEWKIKEFHSSCKAGASVKLFKMGPDDPQNKMIFATGGYDHTIHFWLAHSGVRSFSVQHPSSQVNSMEITPNRQLLAAAGFQHIRMYDINSNNANPVVNYEGVPKNFTAVGFQEEGRWMFTGSEDSSVKIWDLRSRTLQCQRMFGTSAPVNCVCLHPNQSELYIGDQSGSIYMWDLRAELNEQQTKKPFFKVAEPHISIQSIHIDTEGKSMTAVDNKGSCYLFTLSYGTEHPHTQPIRRMKFEAHNTYGLKCKFSPDSTLLVTTSADCTAKLWRTSDLQLLLEQSNSPQVEISGENGESSIPKIVPMVVLENDNQRWVWDVAFSADSQYLFTASSDNLARLWSISTGSIKREYSGHSKALTALAFKDGV